MSWGKWPVLQVALDFTSLKEALRVARRVVKAGELWLEAGTPLIKAEGIRAVKRLRALLPKGFIVADMKVADAGRIEAGLAISAGASMVSALAWASDEAIREVVETCREHGVKVVVDLMDAPDPCRAAERCARLGADAVIYHVGYSRQEAGVRAIDEIDRVRELASRLSIPVAVAGGIRHGEASRFVEAGCKILIVGKAVTRASDPADAAKALIEEITRASEPP